ncbi:flagellar biosynthesis protein [Stutzerimonas stutzeri]|uniref:flagellar biosynthesis protein n=1 Tax=Stutzerimonas stutzeri TaxID=316 RepID=UPI0030143CEC
MGPLKALNSRLPPRVQGSNVPTGRYGGLIHARHSIAYIRKDDECPSHKDLLMKSLFLASLKTSMLVVLAASMVGCVTSRSVVDVSVPVLTGTTGQKVVITTFDERTFEAKPRSADIPSLKGGEINDTSITERAFARKRNGYGKALGDVVLPSGRSVSQLVGTAVANAYSQSGYQVVERPSADARQVTVRIKEFWTWFSPGFASVTVNNKANLIVETDGQSPMTIATEVNDGMQFVTDGDWAKVTSKGLLEVTSALGKKLEASRTQ